MTRFFNLTKAIFLSGFQVNRKNKNQKSSLQMVGIFGLIFLAVSSFYSWMIFESLGRVSASYESVLILVLEIGAVLTITISLFQMQGVIFKTKDFEFLESLPLGKSEIVAAKIFSFYLINLFEDLIIALPSIVLYVVFTGNVFPAIISFVAVFFISLIPLCITSLVSAIISLLIGRTKHKNAVSMIFYFIFFVAIFSGSMIISYSSQNPELLNVGAFLYFDWLLKAFNISTWYYLFLFIGVNVVGLGIAIAFISAFYRKINVSLSNSHFHEEYKGTKNESLTQSEMLLKKERNMVFKRVNYALNAIYGPFIFLICAVFMLIIPSFVASGNPATTPEEIQEMEMMKVVMVGTVPCLGLLFNSMMNSTAGSISMEGNCFESLLAYPIEAKDIIKAKLTIGIAIPAILNCITSVIIIILTGCLYGFTLANVPFFIEIIVFPLLGCTFTAITGMLTGLRWPKLNYENEMQALKNSAAVNFLMLFSFVPSILVLTGEMVFVVLSSITGFSYFIYIGLAIAIVLYGLGILVTYSILKNRGEYLFNKIVTREKM